MTIFFRSRLFITFFILLWAFSCVCFGDYEKKSVNDNRDDNGDTNEESKDETMEIPAETESTNLTCTRRKNSNVHAIVPASPGQFPFMAALMSNEDEYLCSGTVVSNGMILTTAECTSRSIGYVLLNSTKGKKERGSVVLHVVKTEKYPTFTGSESLNDVALVYTEKHNGTVASKLKLGTYTSTRDLIDIEAFGYGLNSEVGQIRALQYVGLENRSPFEVGNVLKGYLDCIETKIMTCFRDTGGPVIYNNELVGIVTTGQYECSKEMTTAYAVNKRMATVLPTYTFKSWLDDRITKNQEHSPMILTTYPGKPVGRMRLSANHHHDTKVIRYSARETIHKYSITSACLFYIVSLI